MVKRDFPDYVSIPDAVLVVGRDGSIVSANEHAERVFGYEHGKLVGLTLESLIPERYRKRHAPLAEGFFAKPAARPMGTDRELLGLRSDGREFPVEIAIGPSASGTHTVAVVRDITALLKVRGKLGETLVEIKKLRDRLQAENVYFQAEIKSSHNFDDIIGNSEPMMLTLHKVELVAPTDSTVLILGETGSGKELLARAIHDRSKRRDRPLVKIDCTTLPAGLAESELFGHQKGAFTGAYESQVGRFELADGGTVFLDELGELSIALQAKLLRVIQEGEFQRLGSKRVQKTDVRLIAATNRDLRNEIREGRFRSDLYYRLGVFLIESPPLRDRREDIPLLVSYFVARFSTSVGKRFDSVAQSSMDALLAYDWPGNVRELQNVIERSLILCPAGTLHVREAFGNSAASPRASERSLKHDLQNVERSNILRALRDSGWKVKGEGNAASRLGLKPSTLQSRMKTLGITRP